MSGPESGEARAAWKVRMIRRMHVATRMKITTLRSLILKPIGRIARRCKKLSIEDHLSKGEGSVKVEN